MISHVVHEKAQSGANLLLVLLPAASYFAAAWQNPEAPMAVWLGWVAPVLIISLLVFSGLTLFALIVGAVAGVLGGLK